MSSQTDILQNMARLRQRESIFLFIVLFVNFVGVFLNESSFDSGDSILHYLMSKQAFQYPSYLLHHWAKPLFVLLSSPFAQLGFGGMKLFNAFCIILALIYSSRLQCNSTCSTFCIIGLLIGLSMPDVFRAQSSGLTEPLFAMMLCGGILLYFRGNLMQAVAIWSFLPFVRSEGWILIPVIAVLMLLDKNWKYLPFFILGTVLYSIIGSFHYNDILWVFHENPYQGEEVKYGSGNWNHYLVQLMYGMGLPLFLLLISGSLLLAVKHFFMKKHMSKAQMWSLILFWAFFSAHTIFWAMGWFHSFGLRRVFIAVLPLTLLPIQFVLDRIGSMGKWGIRSRLALITLIVIFPFTGSPMGYGSFDAFKKDSHQLAADQAAQWLSSSIFNKNTIAFGYHYLAEAMDRDMDNPDQVRILEKNNFQDLPQETIVIWDDYFAVSDKGLTEESFKDSSKFEFIKEFFGVSSGKKSRISIYRKSM